MRTTSHPVLRSLTTSLVVALALASCGGDEPAASPTAEASVGTTTSSSTAAPEGGSEGTRTVNLTIERGPNQMAAPTCVDTSCVYTFGNADLTITGDFEGTAVSGGVGAPQPGGGYGGTGYVVFTGTVSACGGAGTVAWTDRVVQAADGSAEGSWEIVEGSGTGALEGLTGSGSGTTPEPDVAPDGSGTVVVEGEITCNAGS